MISLPLDILNFLQILILWDVFGLEILGGFRVSQGYLAVRNLGTVDRYSVFIM